MSTSFDKVIGRFLRKVNDYNLLEISNSLKDELILELLDSACGIFHRLCKNDLEDRDEISREFIPTLTSMEINIITELMVQEWIQPYQNNTELLETSLTTRDYSHYAEANGLRSVSSVAERIEKKCDKLMKDYSYFVGEVDNIGRGV